MVARKYKRIPTKVTEKEFNEFFLPYLSMPRTGPKPKVTYFKKFNYILKVLITGCQWKELTIDQDTFGRPEIHYSNIHKVFARWARDGSLEKVLLNSIARLSEAELLNFGIIHGDGTTESAKKGGDNIGVNGHKKIKGCKSITFSDRSGNIIAPALSAAGNRNECSLFKAAFAKVKATSKKVGFNLKGIVMSLDGICNSKANRKIIFNSAMKPNINLRACDKKRSGRPKHFSEAIFKERFQVIERTFAWEDKFKRLLIRFERVNQLFDGFKTIAHTLINLRHFCQ